jgi:23S rRNA pseudouridine1911/1915/1917 synthase
MAGSRRDAEPDRSTSEIVRDVPTAAAGMRLDRFVASLPGIGTRSQVQRLIDAGRVRVDVIVRKRALPLRAGAHVTVSVPPPPRATVEAEPLPLTILYEDEALLAIDKPPGMVVHPAPGARRGTVVNALLHHLAAVADVGDPERPGIVHRLDRDTSGVLLVARTVAALEGLARQFRERQVDKRYLAVVRGRLMPTTGVIDRPIGRHPRERKRMSVRSRRGRTAVTRWEVLEYLRGATLVRLLPETGRTHQLRVHLAARGHPVVGDRLYGSGRAKGPTFSRQALHAEEIRFAHPTTGRPVVVVSPLPPDLQGLLAAFRAAGETRPDSGPRVARSRVRSP